MERRVNLWSYRHRSYAGIKGRNHLWTFFLHVPEIGVNLRRREKTVLSEVIKEGKREGITGCGGESSLCMYNLISKHRWVNSKAKRKVTVGLEASTVLQKGFMFEVTKRKIQSHSSPTLWDALKDEFTRKWNFGHHLDVMKAM